MLLNLKKALRYSNIYGFKRTIVKSLGRLRIGLNFPLSDIFIPTSVFKKRRIAIIGCGQFAFSTIAYFINSNSPYRVSKVFDINIENSHTLSRFYGCKAVSSIEQIFSSEIDIVYIASNHESHTKYAIMAIEKGLDVYIEKPLSVTMDQINSLERAYISNSVNIFCGYNRPFSAAIKRVKEDIDNTSPLMVSFFVIGHFINADHWYRDPKEGTRVCGNLGHWIDLSIHLINKTDVREFNIVIVYSDKSKPDDNLVILLKSRRGDLFSITMTSYSEPYEGISETINIHQSGYQVLIDDFRAACFQKGGQRKEIKYNPKDVGHREAILQPFKRNSLRDFNEVIISTKLMLYIADLVRTKTEEGNFKW